MGRIRTLSVLQILLTSHKYQFDELRAEFSGIRELASQQMETLQLKYNGLFNDNGENFVTESNNCRTTAEKDDFPSSLKAKNMLNSIDSNVITDKTVRDINTDKFNDKNEKSKWMNRLPAAEFVPNDEAKTKYDESMKFEDFKAYLGMYKLATYYNIIP